MRSPVLSAFALVPLAYGLIAAAPPVDGPVDTLPQGRYHCSLPGDAGGKARVPVPALDFTIGNSSSYRTEDGSGVYLLRGKSLQFTRGPLKGKTFERTGENTVTLRNGGSEAGDLRCVRSNAR
ncbi:hypothetical protein F7D01_13990 [Erythrobacter sp. 3-20A1M]|uniref:hypothetical protein n=1 Tax=Erythrobacter sp. 3-20A1M TaxID=2653850 RepID=UPI001BFC7266|nr:hypothetical protein [Erythrobacter sp. 3-20A1M]QWC58028.1 hypothetical protein F7D01_13990 [Erythrobacter sp. 3-20A1M]